MRCSSATTCAGTGPAAAWLLPGGGKGGGPAGGADGGTGANSFALLRPFFGIAGAISRFETSVAATDRAFHEAGLGLHVVAGAVLEPAVEFVPGAAAQIVVDHPMLSPAPGPDLSPPVGPPTRGTTMRQHRDADLHSIGEQPCNGSAKPLPGRKERRRQGRPDRRRQVHR